MRLLFQHIFTRLAVALAATVWLSALPLTLFAQADSKPLAADEYSVKAAFLLNLAKFTAYPVSKLSDDDSPLVIGVAGEEGFQKASAVLKDKMVDRHIVLVRRLATAEEAKDCHILFVTRAEQQRTAEFVAQAGKSFVLAVGETDKFLDTGGMIRFYLEADNLRLEISDRSIRQAGLSIKHNALFVLVKKGIAKIKEN